MSLINEALKKAQRMRAQETAAPAAPGGSGPPASTVTRRERPMPARTLVLAVSGGVALVAVSVTATFFLLRSDPPAAAPAAPATAREPAPAPLVQMPPVNVPPAPTGPVLPTTAGQAPGPAPAPAKAAPVEVASAAPKAAVPPATDTPVPASPASSTPPPPASANPAPEPAAPATTPPGPPRPNPRVHDFLDGLRVTGIRASPTDPRVSMNDRVFKLNDVVDRNLGLRIIAIEPTKLTFIDAAGVVYAKNF